MADFTSLLRDLRARCPGISLLENEPLARHCSFRIGGPCAAMVLPSSEEEISQVCRLLREAGEEPLLMGNGTNLLITDSCLPRLVLRLGEDFSRWEVHGTQMTAQSGVSLARLATAALRASLSGLEFAHGIPGSLGGAVMMNAGAYGGEMKDVVTSVRYLDKDLRLQETRSPDFRYRHSRFSSGEELVLGAALALEAGDAAAISGRMQELLRRRQASQPLDQPSAGSTFKRPASGYAAALIQEAGLKGFAIGGAMVSPKHSGFVVNTGGATFDDVLRLMEHVQKTVLRTSGVLLEPEVRIVRR